MAVQVRETAPGAARFGRGTAARPHLYVVDLASAPALPFAPGRPDLRSVSDRRQALRRRRLGRRLRQAGEAAGWAAGSAILIGLVLGGMAGLLH